MLGLAGSLAPVQATTISPLVTLRAFLRDVVAPGQYLGAVTFVSRDGRTIDWSTAGHRDLARTSPMRRDAIFRIYSMTKTVATVAVLALMEDGKLALDDPVGRHLPEFSGRPETVRQLLTHTSGFAPPTEAMEESADLKAYSEAAARVPGAAPPGTRFEYNSVNSEVASRLVEGVSGMVFGDFLRKRIFDPLRMNDTGFSVPRDKRARIAAMTSTDADGRLISWPAPDSERPGDPLRPYQSGAGGLYSTAGDFARFCHMLLNNGAAPSPLGEGRGESPRILRAATVDMMMTHQLTSLDRARGPRGTDPPVLSQYNEGFGLGGFVNLDDPKRERPGSVGAFGWSGAAGTYFMIDRKQGVVAMLFTQHIPRGLPRDPPKPSFRFYKIALLAARTR